MSFPKPRLVFSAFAQNDLDGILAYTLARWGDAQLEKYAGVLDEAFKRIETAPQSGRVAFGPYLKLYAGEHVVFYRVDGYAVTIIRILHRRMDSTRHLPHNE